MWSTNASPVATLTRPRPSRATAAFNWVSLLLRTISPVLFKSHHARVRARAQAFHRRQAPASVAEHPEVASLEAQHAGWLQEPTNAKSPTQPPRPHCQERL